MGVGGPAPINLGGGAERWSSIEAFVKGSIHLKRVRGDGILPWVRELEPGGLNVRPLRMLEA